MTDQEWKDFITCPKEVSDKIIAYYGLDNPGTYIYHGERTYDKKTKKYDYLITWPSLAYIVKDWDVRNVTNMRRMFWRSKFNGDISNWDISNVTNMYNMFSRSKFNRDISNWIPMIEKNDIDINSMGYNFTDDELSDIEI